MKLLQEVNTAFNHNLVVGKNFKSIAEKMEIEGSQLNESINHVLVNIETTVMSGEGLNLDIVQGNAGSLAGLLAGLEYLVQRERISDSLAAYFSAVGIRNGVITHAGATAQIAQVGAKRRQSRKRAIELMINDALKGDREAAAEIRNISRKIRVNLDRAMRSGAVQPTAAFA